MTWGCHGRGRTTAARLARARGALAERPGAPNGRESRLREPPRARRPRRPQPRSPGERRRPAGPQRGRARRATPAAALALSAAARAQPLAAAGHCPWALERLGPADPALQLVADLL